MPKDKEVSRSIWIETDQLIAETKGLIYGIILTAGDDDNAKLTLYDGTDDTGEKLFTIKTTSGTSEFINLIELPKEFKNGLYINLVGTGAKALVWRT